jgi:hypothetical protein
MPDPTTTGFIPRWLRDQPLDEREPHFQTGSIPDSDPRVVTRLVPNDHGYSLPARTVSRVIDLKQDLVYYAAFDIVEGHKPGFADLSAVPKAIRDAATLALEPAEAGSFIIPARLPFQPRVFDADAVLARFADLFASIDEPAKAAEVSIGALQVCRELGRHLGRDLETIEVTTYDRENAPRPTAHFTRATVVRLDKLLSDRRTTTREFEKLTGRLEAIDLGKNEFQLKLEGHRKRVRGTAAFFSLTSLRERLGETVTLEGDVVRDRKSITMTAYRVVEGDVE